MVVTKRCIYIVMGRAEIDTVDYSNGFVLLLSLGSEARP